MCVIISINKSTLEVPSWSDFSLAAIIMNDSSWGGGGGGGGGEGVETPTSKSGSVGKIFFFQKYPLQFHTKHLTNAHTQRNKQQKHAKQFNIIIIYFLEVVFRLDTNFAAWYDFLLLPAKWNTMMTHFGGLQNVLKRYKERDNW